MKVILVATCFISVNLFASGSGGTGTGVPDANIVMRATYGNDQWSGLVSYLSELRERTPHNGRRLIDYKIQEIQSIIAKEEAKKKEDVK